MCCTCLAGGSKRRCCHPEPKAKDLNVARPRSLASLGMTATRECLDLAGCAGRAVFTARVIGAGGKHLMPRLLVLPAGADPRNRADRKRSGVDGGDAFALALTAAQAHGGKKMQMAFSVAALDYARLMIPWQQRLGEPCDAAPASIAARGGVFEPDEEIAARARARGSRRRDAFGVDRLVHASVEFVRRRFRRQRLGGVIGESLNQF